MRKAQGIGINIIIIAAIALLVLIIVAVLVARAGGDVRDGLESCAVKGGTCVSFSDPNGPPAGTVATTEYKCQDGYTCYVAPGQ